MKENSLLKSVIYSVLVPMSAMASAITRSLVIIGVAAIAMLARPASALEPLVALTVTPNHDLTTTASWEKPIIIKSDEDAAKHFDAEALKTLKGTVDWKNQFVLTFVWMGSGQDVLEHIILESFPEQVVFTMKPGMTKDLRGRAAVYALRSNVKWSVKLRISPSELYLKIQPGMSRAEVDALLGSPTSPQLAVGDTVWYLSAPRIEPHESPAAPGTIGVRFTADGKVASKLMNPQAGEK